MKRNTILAAACAIAIMTFASPMQAQQIFNRGEGKYVYTGYEPLKDKPITLYYYIPSEGDIATMPILFAMHGSHRDATEPLEVWKDFAERDRFILLCPEYSSKYYTQDQYQYGNVSKSRNRFVPVPKEEWTYNTIEAIFDFFKKETGNVSDKYDIWGHSAGAQFVSRFLLCMPEARVNRAVAANAGTWTFVTDGGLKGKDGAVYGWPYSIKGTPFESAEYLKPYFARDLYINLGTHDIDTTKDDFAKYPAAMAEGTTRYERGNKFFKECQHRAKEMKCTFNWHKSEVKGSGHTQKTMVYGTYERVDGKKIYDVENIRHTGGYWLIYGNR